MDREFKKEFEKLDKKTNAKIDSLARMTKRSFDAVDKRFEQVDKRFDKLEVQVNGIANQVNGIANQMFTKEDAKVLEERIQGLSTREQMKESLVNDDKILKKLGILEQEKIVREYQEENQQKALLMIISALYKHKILTKNQVEEINKLGVI